MRHFELIEVVNGWILRPVSNGGERYASNVTSYVFTSAAELGKWMAENLQPKVEKS